MKPSLSTHQWLQIAHLVRLRIAAVFSLTKSEGTFLEGGVLRSDGYTYKDLQGITLQGLQHYLKDFDDLDYYSLINKLVERITNEKTTEEEAYARIDKEQAIITWTNALQRLKEEAENKHLLSTLLEILHNMFAFQAIHITHQPHETAKETKKLGRPKGGKKTA